MLLGAALVVALMRDRRHEAGLVVVPADCLDVGQRAQLRACAIGRDRKAGADRAAVRERNFGDAPAGESRATEAASRTTPGPGKAPTSAATMSSVNAICASGRRLWRRSGDAAGAPRRSTAPSMIAIARIGWALFDRLPRAEAFEKQPWPLRRWRPPDGRFRAVAGGRMRGIDHGDRNALAQRPFEGRGEGEAGHAAARDRDVENPHSVRHRALVSFRLHCRTFAARAQSEARGVPLLRAEPIPS